MTSGTKSSSPQSSEPQLNIHSEVVGYGWLEKQRNVYGVFQIQVSPSHGSSQSYTSSYPMAFWRAT
jgi:hypothetical protein